MCGIAGYIGANPPTLARIAACEVEMARRGPDANGRHTFELAPGQAGVLLHSRLAIIDLDMRANQPMQRGTHVIATNGEIYNYREMRRTLENEGQRFKTLSDTEVMLAAIEAWGLEVALDKAEGMWAFVTIDAAKRTLTLVRDRFGEKPLYLWEADDGLYFGSEVKFLFALSGRRAPVNTDHLCRYLVNGYKALYKVKGGFFEGVRELPPGTSITIDRDGHKHDERYWSHVVAQDQTLDFDESVERARAALIDAVGLRLRADVPLAFCLSGGVDSNAIISIARRHFDHEVHGFTIVNTDARYEEQDIVDASVAELGLQHTEIPLSTDGFLDNLRTLVQYHDAPVYTLSYYVHWMLMQAVAEQGYRVSVSGTAADELFTGYYDHHNAYLYEISGDPDRHAHARADWEEHVAPIVRNPFLGNPNLFLEDPNFRGHIYLNADRFSAALATPWSEPFDEERYCDGLLRNRMLNELFNESVPVILHEDDLNAMYFSIENRSPFLDRKLFETAGQIPTRHLVRNGYAKAVLREAVRGIAPDPVVESRRKVGFNAPIADLLDVGDPDVRAQVLDDGPIYDLVRRESVEELLNSDSELTNSESKFLFNVVCTRMFLEGCTQDGSSAETRLEAVS